MVSERKWTAWSWSERKGSQSNPLQPIVNGEIITSISLTREIYFRNPLHFVVMRFLSAADQATWTSPSRLSVHCVCSMVPFSSCVGSQVCKARPSLWTGVSHTLSPHPSVPPGLSLTPLTLRLHGSPFLY